MATNYFSTGRDVALDITTEAGPLRFSLITAFSSKPDLIDVKVKGLDGITRHARFPDGWTGKFNVTRQDATIDNYFAQLEANYYAGLHEKPATITETITEPNGAVSQFKYLQVLLKLDDAGEFKGDKTVEQTVTFVASRRVKVS